MKQIFGCRLDHFKISQKLIQITNSNRRKPVDCLPKPDAFNPCEDVMGYKWLRICVWIVVLIGLMGNASVLVVNASKFREMTVQSLLILNLALADICMAAFLLLIAIQDLISKDNYFNYAYDWQQGQPLIHPPKSNQQLLSLEQLQRKFHFYRHGMQNSWLPHNFQQSIINFHSLLSNNWTMVHHQESFVCAQLEPSSDCLLCRMWLDFLTYDGFSPSDWHFQLFYD